MGGRLHSRILWLDANSGAKAAVLISTDPGMDGLKKSDSRFGTTETGLKTDDQGNGRKSRSLTILSED